MLVLDRAGEQLLATGDGPVEGRMAFFDSAVDGRWGGVITSDRVEADFAPCPCGRRSPTVLSVARYDDLDDDKLTCAGTMSSYVRGAAGAD